MTSSPPTMLTPIDAFAAWPSDAPLAAMLAGAHSGAPWPADAPARFSLLAAPARTFTSHTDPLPPTERSPAPATPSRAPSRQLSQPPHRLRSGWLGSIAYELGHALDPAFVAHRFNRPWTPRTLASNTQLPLSVWQRVDHAHVFDHATHTWHTLGDPARLPSLADLAARAHHQPPAFTLTTPTSAVGEQAYQHAVAHAVRLIREGDAYQINLAHPLSAHATGSSRALFAALARHARPVHGLYLELPRHDAAILSLSPETFLLVDGPSRRVTTRPMKGTRPAGTPDAVLDLAPKDRAELAMIIDLMRNDLGRVAQPRSVRVDAPRLIEHHAGVIQATATVSATLRDGLTLRDLLAATFPAGSVTGAPRLRAMQIIDELEPHPRHHYCGCAGYLADPAPDQLDSLPDAVLAVTIRTATLTGRLRPGSSHIFDTAQLRYPVGAGIVADSAPDAEWAETLVKASALTALTTPTPAPAPAPANTPS